MNRNGSGQQGPPRVHGRDRSSAKSNADEKPHDNIGVGLFVMRHLGKYISSNLYIAIGSIDPLNEPSTTWMCAQGNFLTDFVVFVGPPASAYRRRILPKFRKKAFPLFMVHGGGRGGYYTYIWVYTVGDAGFAYRTNLGTEIADTVQHHCRGRHRTVALCYKSSNRI